jgi:hypothetical protein
MGRTSSRQRRWTHGDWQLLPWLMPRVPTTSSGATIRNPLRPLARWKLFDNLRRGLVAPALLGSCYDDPGWHCRTTAFWSTRYWRCLSTRGVGRDHRQCAQAIDIPLLMHLRLQRGDAILEQLVQVLLGLVFLPYEETVVVTVGGDPSRTLPGVCASAISACCRWTASDRTQYRQWFDYGVHVAM